MAEKREHKEFYQVEMSGGWESPPGYPAGIQQKILTGGLDAGNKRGRLTRMLRFLPGARSTEPFVHDFWEEVFLLSGELIVGADADGKGGKVFRQYTHCCRPPGIPHGPFRSETGCLLVETHYYESL